MKTKIKYVLLAMAMFVLFICLSATASADTVIKMDAEAVKRDKADVSFTCGASYLTSMELYVDYDSTVLTYSGCELGADGVKNADGSAAGYCGVQELGNGRLLVSFFAAKATETFNSDLLQKPFMLLHFDIAENAKGNTTVNCSMKNVFVSKDNTGKKSASQSASNVKLNSDAFAIPTVKGLIIKNTKNAYCVGEATAPDFSKMTIQAQYTTGDYLPLTIEDCVVDYSMFNGSSAGAYMVFISYAGFKKEEVLIVYDFMPVELQIEQMPDCLEYVQNSVEELDLSGIVVNVLFEDKTSEQVDPSDLTVTGFDPSTVGKQTITVSYSDLEATFEIDVVSPVQLPIAYKDDFLCTVQGVKTGDLIKVLPGAVIKTASGAAVAADDSTVLASTMTVTTKDGTVYTVVVLGDTDEKSGISSSDARITLRLSVRLEDTTIAWRNIAADVNGNGVSAGDARLILRASVKLEDSSAWIDILK